jgi:aerobic-type carbon monoxide dehydrogenase small subunit (CoxS/CutS family)
MALTLRVNGAEHRIRADPRTPLIYVLRNELNLKGTKLACGLEQCGACAVLVDGRVTMSCVSETVSFAGKDIITIEGVAALDIGTRVQAAFQEASAAQCGYCTAGLVIAVTGLLETTPNPTDAKIRAALTSHLCRCGSHPRVLRAVQIAIDPT